MLDLAAGTGKLTRQIAPSGAELVAVEPIAEMRAKLEASSPDVEALDGTAEAIPLPNHSVDAVVVGQAFHWFDGVRAVSEIRRVLRPGGALGLIWQARDPRLPWIERLDEIIDRADDGHPRFRTWRWRDAFDRTALFEPLRGPPTFETVQRGSARDDRRPRGVDQLCRGDAGGPTTSASSTRCASSSPPTRRPPGPT